MEFPRTLSLWLPETFKLKYIRHQDAIPKEFFTLKGPRTEHIRIPNIRDRSNNNMVERLHGTIRQRNKVMRGLDDVETAQTMMDGLRIYYNFLRPNMALRGKTPSEVSRVAEPNERTWENLIRKSAKGADSDYLRH